MGSKVLTKVQYGKETTHGTAVAADTMLLCAVSLPESDREVKIPEVMIGARTNLLIDSAYVARVVADGITLEDADGAYFQLMPLLFSMVLKGNITATEQTSAQNDYLWTFDAPQTGSETLDSITLEVGDDTQAYEIAYCLGRSASISFDCDSGEVHCSADLFGDKVAQTTITGGQSVPTAEMMVGTQARLYIDSTWAGLGDTELEGALVSGEITINGGGHPKHLGSSQREFDSHGQDAITGTMNLTLERTSDVATEELNYRPASGYAVTERFVRVAINGSQIGSGDNSSLTIDMAGVWTGWHSLDSDRNGNTLDAVTLTAGYDSTGSQGVSVNVTTTVGSI